MPDLFDDLRDVPPAFGSAADARHRGDHLRRRRTATVVAGSALALALTVGGVAWSQVGAPSTAPDPVAPHRVSSEPAPTPSPPTAPGRGLTPQPGPASPTAIAADFPLAAGWPEADGEELELQGPSPRLDAFDRASCAGRSATSAPPAASSSWGTADRHRLRR